MSAIRRAVLAAAIVGAALWLPQVSEAYPPTCPTGGPWCPGTLGACESYCQKKGQIFDYCNTAHCCVCIPA